MVTNEAYALAEHISHILNDMGIKVSKTRNTRKNHSKTCAVLIAEQLIEKGLIK